MIDQYKQLASDIVEYGKKLGADQVSTSLVNAVSFQVEVRDGKIESLKESGSAGMYVTLLPRPATLNNFFKRPPVGNSSTIDAFSNAVFAIHG